MYREKAIEKMKGYFQDDRFIEHTLKVLTRAEQICEGEKIDAPFILHVASLGSIFHDIGIPEALKKHSSMEAPYQEQEGPPVARKLMDEVGIRPDILERVCYIVGHHHTAEKVDGLDFQVIWEADFIVNIDEGNIVLEPGEVEHSVEENLKTATGQVLIREVL
jgi:HD superfamily phosphodiesterase